MSTKLTRVAAVLTVASGLALGATAPAQAASPVIYRFHAVHNAFSGDNEICGIAASWTYTENATIKAMTAKDITSPDIFAYGKVLGPVTETYTTARGSVTVERRLALSDVRQSYSRDGAVITWQTKLSGSLRLIDNATGRTLTSGSGMVVFHEVWDTDAGVFDETVDSASGTMLSYFDESCAAVEAALT